MHRFNSVVYHTVPRRCVHVTALMYVLLFFVGASIASCSSCIIYRIPRGMDWVRGHSCCEGCGRRLHPWELIPVISCLALRGRCPTCGAYFGYSHAIREGSTGVLFVFLFLMSSGSGASPIETISTLLIFIVSMLLSSIMIAKGWK